MIVVQYQPTEIQLEEVFTNIVDKKFQISCRDMGGHTYSWGACSRCGHDVTPEVEDSCSE